MGIDLLDITFRIDREIGVRMGSNDWPGLMSEERDCTVRYLYELVLSRAGSSLK